MEKLEYIVGENQIRLDKFLLEQRPDQSRAYYQKLIKDGQVSVNDKAIMKTGFSLMNMDKVVVIIPSPVTVNILPENLNLDILYEDDDVIIVNKPKGMVVHPSAGHPNHTLVNGIIYHCGEHLSHINGEIRPGIVHRIDRNTTGALIVCKNDRAHRNIAEQIKKHSVTRIYKGIVTGRVKEEEGIIEGNIGRDSKNRKKMAVVSDGGKSAITHYKVLERFQRHTFMEFRLETGRTHQIRVHMSHIGHPLFGDELYGKAVKKPYLLEGQTLHAETIGFQHPFTGQYIEINAELPAYFKKLLSVLPK